MGLNYSRVRNRASDCAVVLRMSFFANRSSPLLRDMRWFAASGRFPAPQEIRDDGQDRQQAEGADEEKYRARMSRIHHGAEQQRRDDAADIEAGRHESEHLA